MRLRKDSRAENEPSRALVSLGSTRLIFSKVELKTWRSSSDHLESVGLELELDSFR